MFIITLIIFYLLKITNLRTISIYEYLYRESFIIILIHIMIATIKKKIYMYIKDKYNNNVHLIRNKNNKKNKILFY